MRLIASSAHKLSGLNGPFIAVNVAGLDDNMFSGTLFPDENGDLNIPSQTKLPQSLFICLERMSIPYDIPGFGRHCFSAYYLRSFHLTWYKKKSNLNIGLFNMNKTHGNRGMIIILI